MFPTSKRISLELRYLFILYIINRVEELEKYNANAWLLSPPCQPHTRQGMKKDCADNRSDGLMHIIELLQKINKKPEFLLLENVEGFERSQSRELLMNALKQKGYHSLEFILSPNQFQIPNQRDRYFLIARLTPFPEIPPSTPRIGDCLRVIPGNKNCVNIVYQNGTAEMGTKESQELWNSLNSQCKCIREFLDNEITLGQDLTPHLLKKQVLQKSGKTLDIVTPDDKYSCCFTKAYRKYHTGTGSVLQTVQPYQEPPVSRDIDNLLSLHLRYFTGSEMKRLHGFPDSFTFPDDMTENQRAKLVGNISFLLLELSFSSFCRVLVLQWLLLCWSISLVVLFVHSILL